MTQRLPIGFTVELNRKARLLDDRTILGGSPTRLSYLSERGRGLLVDRRITVRDNASAILADRLLASGTADPVIGELPPLLDASYTFVVPVKDRPDELDRLLTSIGHGHRVLVVDDGSDDPAAVAAVTKTHDAELISLSVNVGPGGARNAGLARVRTPFVVFVDSDIVLDDVVVPTLLRHFADPKVGMAVPRIAGLRTDRSQTWWGRYEQARSSLDLGRHPAAVQPGSPVSWASSACAVVRMTAAGDGFEAEMRVGEDVDFGWRLVAGGWRVRYEPSVVARHEHRAAFADWFTRKAVYGTGAHPLAQRHPQDIAPAIFAPWSATLVIALLWQRRWSFCVAAVTCMITTSRIARRLDRVGHPVRTAVWLTANGAVGASAQVSALMLRHWWPVTALAAPWSRRVRRAAAVAAVLDVAMEYRRGHAGLDPLRFGIARRLDDLAYGSGVWWSAWRGKAFTALRPRIRRLSAR